MRAATSAPASVIGSVRLDAIGDLQVQKVKLQPEGMADKTRACVLSLLAEMMGAAERWKEISRPTRARGFTGTVYF